MLVKYNCRWKLFPILALWPIK